MVCYCCTTANAGIFIGLVGNTVYSYIAHACTIEKPQNVLLMLSYL